MPESEQSGGRLIWFGWSTTGQLLAVIVAQQDESRLCLVVPDSPESWTIRDLGPTGRGLPFWSPDDTRIAVASDPAQIYLHSLLDNEAKLLMTGLSHVGLLAWTPGGQGLTAVADDTLYWLSLDGHPPQPLLTRPDLRLTAWAPR